MTTELTPTEENAANRLNDTVTMAINKVIGQDSQSYEEFIGGFQHITKDSVSQQKKSTSQPKFQKSRNAVDSSQTSTKNELTLKVTESHHISDEELDEEILESGTRTTNITSQDPAPRVKFDNFVEEEISDEDMPGYVASFGEKSKETEDFVKVDGPKEHFVGSKCEILSSTDEENVTAKQCQDSESVNNSNELEGSPLIPKNIEDHKCHKDLPQINTEELEGPDFVSEVMEDHTDNNDLLNSDIDKKSDENFSIVNIGNSITSQEITLYPGEAEPEQEIQKGEITNHTHLEFTAVTGSLNCDESSEDVSKVTVTSTDESLSTETPSDEVQPFSLDDDFDYDNVILTPKFTIQEVNHLKSFLPKTNIHT